MINLQVVFLFGIARPVFRYFPRRVNAFIQLFTMGPCSQQIRGRAFVAVLAAFILHFTGIIQWSWSGYTKAIADCYVVCNGYAGANHSGPCGLERGSCALGTGTFRETSSDLPADA